jgi:hypothetical protein
MVKERRKKGGTVVAAVGVPMSFIRGHGWGFLLKGVAHVRQVATPDVW